MSPLHSRIILGGALLWIIRCHPTNYSVRYYHLYNYFVRYYHPSNCFERFYRLSTYTLLSIQVSSLHVMFNIFGQPGVTLRRSLKCQINTKHHITRSNVLKMYPQAGLPTLFAATALILRAQSCNVTLQSNASCRDHWLWLFCPGCIPPPPPPPLAWLQ